MNKSIDVYTNINIKMRVLLIGAAGDVAQSLAYTWKLPEKLLTKVFLPK